MTAESLGGGLGAPVATRATIVAGAAVPDRRFPGNAGTTVAQGAAVDPGAALTLREPCCSLCLEGKAALYLTGGAAVELFQNALPILRTKFVYQLIGADNTRLIAGCFLS